MQEFAQRNFRNDRKSLFLAVMSFVFGSVPAVTAELPQYWGVVNYVESHGSLTVNGVPVQDFSAEVGGSGGTSMNLTEWLMNGPNELALSVDPVNENGRATLELQQSTSDGAVLSVEQEGKGTATATLEVEGLPEWAWQRATPKDGSDGLAASVKAFHAAFADGDMDAIITMARPFLTDQETLGGLSEEIFREELGPFLETGELIDLPDLTIASYHDGRLFHVTGSDGSPPVNLEFESEGMSGAVRTGEWWSVIDGVWQVVR